MKRIKNAHPHTHGAWDNFESKIDKIYLITIKMRKIKEESH